jgi:thioredoxin reductase (NADPH)
MTAKYDVVIVGGGAAGLSAALALVRFRRTVLVVDAGTPRNAPAEGVHNYLTRDGTPPGELLAAGRAEVAGYGGEFAAGVVTSAEPLSGGGFRVRFAGDRVVLARRLLVTTGVVDELPDVDGLVDRWGRDVLHCPYCHGWEVRDQAIGVLASGPFAVHQAQLFRQLSKQVTLFQHTAPVLDHAVREELAARDIAVVDGVVAGLEVIDDKLTGVRLRSGEIVACQALAIQSHLTARAEVLTSLGLQPVDFTANGHVMGSHIPADPTGATEIPGVWVAGNLAAPMAQVISAAAAGLTAGAAINANLVDEDVRQAVMESTRR